MTIEPLPPLVPPEVDLSRLDGFMLDTVALLGSELVALSTGEEFKAAVLLWCRAWKQRPACSLPDNDRVLASFAMVAPARWRKVKGMALHGFVKCADGRLYHPVLAKDALRADAARRQRSEAIKKRWEKEHGKPTEDGTAAIRPYYETPTKTIPTVARDETRRDGTGNKKESPDPESSDAARGIVGDFLDFRKRFWPDDPSVLAATLTLETQARSFLEAGASRRLIAEVFERVMRQKRERAESAPTDLRFCHKTLETEMGKLSRAGRSVAKPAGNSPDAPPIAEPWEQRMRGWRKDQFWRDEWGFRPGARGCRVPDELLLDDEIAAKHGRAA